MQPPPLEAEPPAVEPVEPVEPLDDIAAGIQPPLTQTPPPSDTKGSAVVQPLLELQRRVELELPTVELPLDALDGNPLGTQPPLTQVPPPMDVNGSGVMQAPPVAVGPVADGSVDPTAPVVKLQSGPDAVTYAIVFETIFQ